MTEAERRAEGTARTKARRRAVDVLFEADQRERYRPAGLRALVVERMAVSAAQTSLPQYAADAIAGVADHCRIIDETLSSYIHGWTIDRLPAVDRAILRFAVWELVFNDDVDAAVTISQSVKLATQLSGDDAPGFVNAVLDRIRVVAPAIKADAQARAADAVRGSDGPEGGETQSETKPTPEEIASD